MKLIILDKFQSCFRPIYGAEAALVTFVDKLVGGSVFLHALLVLLMVFSTVKYGNFLN